MFSITLTIKLCIDGECRIIPIFKGVNLPIPDCNVEYQHYLLPGDGTITGFVDALGGKVGNTAVDIVLLKYGLKVRKRIEMLTQTV